METLWLVIPLLLGSVALVYTVVANLLQVWLEHRVKLALLEKLQDDPDRLDTLQDLEAFVASSEAVIRRKPFVDHVVLGVTLAILGIISALAAWCFGGAGWMTGAYIGGVMCVAVGFILTVLGVVTRYLARMPVVPRQK